MMMGLLRATPSKIAATACAGLLCLAGLSVHSAAETKPATAKSDCKERIISIGGDVTEILYALGAGPCIAAVDVTSQYPPQALKEKASVGYMRTLSAEGVLSIGGTVILASDGSGPAEAVRALKASSMRYITVPDNPTPDGVTAKIATISKAIGKTPAGQKLSAKVRAGFKQLATHRERLGKRVRAMFVLASNGERIMVGGRGTSADSIFELAGVENVATSINGFKPVTAEAIINMAPEVIVVMKRRSGSHKDLLKNAAVRTTPAGQNNRVFAMSGTYLLGFGPRTPEAGLDLMRKVYPAKASK